MKYYIIAPFIALLLYLPGCGPENYDNQLDQDQAPQTDAGIFDWFTKKKDEPTTPAPKLTHKCGDDINANEKAPTQEQLDCLAKAFAPQLREHPNERFPLTSAEWFLSKVGMITEGNDSEGRSIVLPGSLSNRHEIWWSEQSGRLHIPPEPRNEYDDIITGKGAEKACYSYPRPVDNGAAIELLYVFFNPYNGTVSSAIPGLSAYILDKIGVGNHEGDWEHITIRLDPTGKNIVGVHYAAHAEREGKWYFEPNTTTTDKAGYKVTGEGQVITWSALDTHGNHNRAGNISRYNALKNDSLTNKALNQVIGGLSVLTERTADSDDSNYTDCRNYLKIFPLGKDEYFKKYPWLAFQGKWGAAVPPYKGNGHGAPGGPHRVNDWWPREPISTWDQQEEARKHPEYQKLVRDK